MLCFTFCLTDVMLLKNVNAADIDLEVFYNAVKFFDLTHARSNANRDRPTYRFSAKIF